jgi:DNA-binding LytR/AlgR family response regulator
MKETKKYTTIIVEDEQLPMLSLMQKLNEYHPEIEVAGTCSDASSAMEMILKHKPDMLFLDIQLPGHDSLWLLEQLQPAMKELPHIIFTTAYNTPDYLLKAIKFQAVDYLLKPVGIIELAAAIARMKEKSGKKAEKKYAFHTFNATIIAIAMDIVYLKADGNYCTLFTAKYTEEPIFERLGEVEEKLAPSGLFIRAGKSYLINKEFIYKIDAQKNTCYLLSHTNSLYKVELSENGVGALKKALGS